MNNKKLGESFDERFPFISYLGVFIVTFERKYYVSCSQLVPMKGNFLLIVDHTVDLLRNGYRVLYVVKNTL